jgi:hypothetical protein
MLRAATRIGSELVPVVLILASLAGTWGLVVAMYRRQAVPKVSASPAVVVRAQPPPTPPPPPARKVAPAPTPPVEDLTGKEVARLAALEAEQRREAERAEQQAQAAERAARAALARAESGRRREMLVRAQVTSLERAAQRIEDEADALAAERDVLARETTSLRAEHTRAQSNSGAAVLPYKGPNGTWRVPIAIECHNGGVTVQPGGPSVSLLELSSVLGLRGSPLIIAVARRLAALKDTSTPDGARAVPYILFVVRPDGIRPYYEARARLELLGLSFGYELVEQDAQIEYPDLADAAEWSETAPVHPSQPAPELVWPGEGHKGRDRDGEGEYVWRTPRPATIDGIATDEGGNAGNAAGAEGTFLLDGAEQRGSRDQGEGLLATVPIGGASHEESAPGGAATPPTPTLSQGENGQVRGAFSASGNLAPLTPTLAQEERRQVRGAVPRPGDATPLTPSLSEGEREQEPRGGTTLSQGARGQQPIPEPAPFPLQMRGRDGTAPAAGTLGEWPGEKKSAGTAGQASSATNAAAAQPGGMPIGLSGNAPARGAHSAFDPSIHYRKEHKLELDILCMSTGVVIHPGEHRLDAASLDTADNRLIAILRSIVAAREAAHPEQDWKPRIKFVVQPGGESTYWKARKQTILSGLGWPVGLQVTEGEAVRVGAAEGRP